MAPNTKFPRDVTIVPARCQRYRERLFGIRAEKMNGTWVMTWAFPMTLRQAKNERYLQNKISGRMALSSEYPGCPDCGAEGFMQCYSCNSISCCNDGQTRAVCPWCGREMELTRTDDFDNITAGGF